MAEQAKQPKGGRKKVSYEARTGMLNQRNREARARRGRRTGPLIWCLDTRGERDKHKTGECGRCGPRKIYFGTPKRLLKEVTA